MFTPAELGEKATRDELTRVFDVCNGCRRCIDLCDVFPTLVALLDGVGGEAGQLTPHDQDQVVDHCVHCRRCVVDCPSAPGRDAGTVVDIPRAMLRATAMRTSTGQLGGGQRRWTAAMRRPRRLRRLVRLAGRSPAHSVRRHLARLLVGMTDDRDGPTARRPAERAAGGRSPLADTLIVPTCVVDAARPDLVDTALRVLERRGVTCSVGSIGCCGAASLHAGDPDAFVAAARRTVAELSGDDGVGPVVVLDPTCAAVIRRQYADLDVAGAAALAARVVAVSAAVLGTAADGDGPAGDSGGRPRTLVHVSGHAQWSGEADADVALVERLGAETVLVVDSAGTESPGGLGVFLDVAARGQHHRIRASLSAGGHHDRVVSSSVLAHPVLRDLTGADPRHPIEVADELDRHLG